MGYQGGGAWGVGRMGWGGGDGGARPLSVCSASWADRRPACKLMQGCHMCAMPAVCHSMQWHMFCMHTEAARHGLTCKHVLCRTMHANRPPLTHAACRTPVGRQLPPARSWLPALCLTCPPFPCPPPPGLPSPPPSPLGPTPSSLIRSSPPSLCVLCVRPIGHRRGRQGD